MKTCDKCRGTMLPERAVDLDAGLAITVFACLNCGRRKAADQEPRPLTARHWPRDDGTETPDLRWAESRRGGFHRGAVQSRLDGGSPIALPQAFIRDDRSSRPEEW